MNANTIPYGDPSFCISPERIRHMHGVAELMQEYAVDFECTRIADCYLIGLLHDIGYIDGKEEHEETGCRILAGHLVSGEKDLIAHCIRWHSAVPTEYMQENQCTADDIPKELILLWWADMMVESEGEHAGDVVGYQGRLTGLEKRYGMLSPQYRTCREKIAWLTEYIAARL